MQHDTSRAVLAAATLLGLGLGVSAVNAATPPAVTSSQQKTADQWKQSTQFKQTATVSAEGANDTPAPVVANQYKQSDQFKQSAQLKQSDQFKSTAGTASAEGANDAPLTTTTADTTTGH